ncbi:hypothetical protein GCM10010430_66050 [Kitasatospora cystarginea]|uniref:Uncharacterized protein n=1 Tax=Kitasatospora cystarginea TaxID=58350 RepID=A0ABN3ETQ1_9ACTN
MAGTDPSGPVTSVTPVGSVPQDGAADEGGEGVSRSADAAAAVRKPWAAPETECPAPQRSPLEIRFRGHVFRFLQQPDNGGADGGPSAAVGGRILEPSAGRPR